MATKTQRELKGTEQNKGKNKMGPKGHGSGWGSWETRPTLFSHLLFVLENVKFPRDVMGCAS